MDETTNTETEATTAEKMVPLKALQAERESLKAIRSELEAMKAEKAESARRAAEEAGEHKRLYEELAPKFEATTKQLQALQEKETARMERVKARNMSRIESLPEEYRSLIPDGLSIDDTTAQIERLEVLATNADTRARGSRSSNGGSQPDPDAIPEAIRQHVEAEANRHNRDPKAWYKSHRNRLNRKFKHLMN